MATELIPFDEFDVVTHIKKQLSSRKTWAAKKKRNRMDSIVSSPPPRGMHSSRPDYTTNGTVDVPPPPAALHRRPGAENNF
jgi:hypothetical protein